MNRIYIDASRYFKEGPELRAFIARHNPAWFIAFADRYAVVEDWDRLPIAKLPVDRFLRDLGKWPVGDDIYIITDGRNLNVPAEIPMREVCWIVTPDGNPLFSPPFGKVHILPREDNQLPLVVALIFFVMVVVLRYGCF